MISRRFGAGKVTAIIKTTLQKILNGRKYETEKVPELITSISNEILAEVKSMCFLKMATHLFLELGYDRYKIVVQVDIGEFKGQGIKLASRCVWDTTTDTWASGSFKNVRLPLNKNVTSALGNAIRCRNGFRLLL